MRIGIVNDLALAVEALRRALSQRPDYVVVWTAANGDEAVARCAQEPPDLVLMDLLMPGMDGVEATRQIMAKSPCAVLVVTTSVGGNASRVFEAMGHGALDAVDLPTMAINGEEDAEGASALLAKIDLIGRLIGDRRQKTARSKPSAARRGTSSRLLAIGASAGGPAAVAEVLGGLPVTFPMAIVVVQHIDEKFAKSMADWLGRFSQCPVRVARPGDTPTTGTVLLAGTNEHLVLRDDGRLDYTCKPVEMPYRPSVDVFFGSVADTWPGQAVGVLLSGMGRDGAIGLKAMRAKGHHTIAQDQASSAVYGMPKAAAELGAAVDILPLVRVAARLRDLS